MGAQEQACWERFCRTGLIADYLEYRSAVDYARRVPAEGQVPGEGAQDAARDQGGGALGQKSGGT